MENDQEQSDTGKVISRTTGTMNAFVMKQIGETGMTEKPIPDAGARDAIVRPTKALICTSDVHTVHGAVGERENLTLGHEAVGIVEEVGEEVELFATGDRVAVGAITPDWNSSSAQDDHPSQSNRPLGGWKFSNLKDGILAGYFHVNDADGNLAKIPDSINDQEAVYVSDMISTGFMGAEKGNIPMGGTVAIFAQGPIGLMCTVGARLQGAGKIIAVESVPERIELAREYGADEIVNFEEHDPVDRILELTDGEGVDTAIEALGSSETFEKCVEVTKAGGTISNVGYHGEGEYVNLPREAWGVGMAEKTINTGLCPGGRLRLERLLRLIKNDRVDPTPMTTHRFPFDEVQQAFNLMENKEDGVIKPLIEFSD